MVTGTCTQPPPAGTDTPSVAPTRVPTAPLLSRYTIPLALEPASESVKNAMCIIDVVAVETIVNLVRSARPLLPGKPDDGVFTLPSVPAVKPPAVGDGVTVAVGVVV